MTESLFTSQTPSSVNNSDGGAAGISTATGIRFAVAGTVSAIRFYATTTVSGNYVAELWEVTADDSAPAGTRVGVSSTVASGSITAAAWNTITLAAPVSVVTGKVYRATVNSSAGRYVATLTFFTVDLVNGNLTADANGDDPVLLGALRQGAFSANSAPNNYPSASGNGTCYFVDVVYAASGPIDVPGVLAAPLGPLTATATGIREVSAVASASLGPLAAVASGIREVAGIALAPLGALTASMTGNRNVSGVLAANLGRLTADMLTVRLVGPQSPIVSQTNGGPITSQTTERTFTAQTRGGVL